MGTSERQFGARLLSDAPQQNSVEGSEELKRLVALVFPVVSMLSRHWVPSSSHVNKASSKWLVKDFLVLYLNYLDM